MCLTRESEAHIRLHGRQCSPASTLRFVTERGQSVAFSAPRLCTIAPRLCTNQIGFVRVSTRSTVRVFACRSVVVRTLTGVRTPVPSCALRVHCMSVSIKHYGFIVYKCAQYGVEP